MGEPGEARTLGPPLALAGGTVVTSLSPPALHRGDLLVADGRVIEPVTAGPAPHADRTIDCTGCLVVPGLVVAHHHLYSALARGMPYELAPPTTFVEVLRRVWWRLDRALDDTTVRLSASAGGADALLSGATTIVDHHASPNAIPGSLDQVAGALQDLGARSVLCYEVTDRDGSDRARSGLEENARFLAAGAFPMARGMVGAHASFTLSEETLGACVDLARAHGSGIHIHVAEDAADQADALARFGHRVVERLADAGALTERDLLAHCIHLDDREVDLIREAGATAVHNPRSNMNNRVGHMRVEGFDRLALGTDGIGGDLFAEGRAAYWRAREADPDVQPGWVLDRLAASARVAAAAFDEPLLGTLQPGAPADLAVLEYDPPTPLHRANLPGHWVFGLSARMVRDVLVAGEEVVRDRRLVRANQAELRARSREGAEGLWRRMAEMGEHPFVPEPGGEA